MAIGAVTSFDHLLEQLIPLLRDGLAAFDREGRCLLWSPIMAELTGLPAGYVTALAGTRVKEVLAPLGLAGPLDQALGGAGTAPGWAALGGPNAQRTVGIAPVRTADGVLVGAVATAWRGGPVPERATDWEDWQLARTVLDSLTDHIAVLDVAGAIITVNQAWQQFALANGATPQTMLGVGANYLDACRRALASEPDAAEAAAALGGIQAVLDRTQPRFAFEYPCHSATEERWFLMVATPLARAQGGAVVAHTNVTERRRATDARARLIELLLTAQEDERRRVALDLHDDIGQALTALLVGLTYAETAPSAAALRAGLPALRAMTGATLDAVRRLARGLRPPVLDDLGFAAALERHVADFSQTHGIQLTLRVVPPDPPRLPARIELTLYRIAQEALTNVARHAHARQVVITFTPAESEVSLTIADDGRGFDPAARPFPGDDAGHIGLCGMAERARLLGGRLEVITCPAGGTTVGVTIPWTQELNHGSPTHPPG